LFSIENTANSNRIYLGGVGTLTVNNAQPVDQGAYTCEAINVKGRVLATPDCIVRIVNIPAPTPPPAPPQLSCRVCFLSLIEF
jgi:hypothetical protein